MPKPLGLKQECLSFVEILSQSVANISPTLTPVMIIPLVFASAGNGTWLAYLFATIGLVAVGLNINQFARRSATPGSLYSYISLGLGVNLGFIAGWSLVAAYLFTGMSVLSGSVNYALILLGLVHVSVSPILLFAVGAALVWYIAYTDIKFSTQLMLVFEAISMLLILTLGAIVMIRQHHWIDSRQFHFASMNVTGLRTGLILAIFSFVGYESATTLGAEARNPLKTIPRAVIGSAVIAGLFFMVTAYIAVFGFQGLPQSLGSSNAPFNELADRAGAHYFGVLISFGVVVSTFACTLASVNAGARILFSMGRLGILHPHLGRTHAKNETPHHSATASSICVFLVPAFLIAFKMAILDIFNDLSTFATYGFLVAYTLIALAAVTRLKKIGKLTLGAMALSGISIVFLIPAIVSAFYPVPPPPLNWLPYAFLAYLLAGWTWFVIQHKRSLGLAAGIREELADLHARFTEPVK